MLDMRYAIRTVFDAKSMLKKLKVANRQGLTRAGWTIMNRAKKSILPGGHSRFKFRKTTYWLRSEKKKYFKELYQWKKNGRHGPRPQARQHLRGLEKISKAGQPPFSHTGHLRKSIAFNINPDATGMIVGPQLHSSKKSKSVLKALEKGGISKNAWGISKQIAARPFMKPALEKERSKIAASWGNTFK